MKSGFIGIIGRPNVGKSTLLNAILGRKIAITSNKPGTTRNNIQGIYTTSNYQMIFVDTPGIHKPKHKFGKILNKQAYTAGFDVDVILFLVDITAPLGKGDNFIIEYLKKVKKPVILVINKIDRQPKELILPKIEEYKDLYNFEQIVPVSALRKDNVDDLLNVLQQYLTDSIKYYDDNMVTNLSTKFLIGEVIREKILELTEEEIPHSVTCLVESIEDKKDNISIAATIIVERESIKKIIIGKNGNMIKSIGRRARIDLEHMLTSKVYLELFVKVVPKWREKERYLKEFGFDYK